MYTKEEYYETVVQCRKLAADPLVTRCPCTSPCEWHGKCKECVALHRHYGDHLPVCLQPIIKGQVKALAATVEMDMSPREDVPAEYREYAKQRDREGK